MKRRKTQAVAGTQFNDSTIQRFNDSTQTISIRNRQRARRIDLRWLRKAILTCLRELLQLESFQIGVAIVDATEMTKVNERYLRHRGSTDVITFDYVEGGTGVRSGSKKRAVHGDIYICIDESIVQAKRFGVSWQQETVRYIVHGVLHLLGYDDRTPAQRKKMKRAEDRLMRLLHGKSSFLTNN